MSEVAAHESAFANEIANFQHRTIALGVAGGSVADKRKAAFCTTWPVVKDGLASLEALVPASVRMIIGFVTRAGDAVAGTICPK